MIEINIKKLLMKYFTDNNKGFDLSPESLKEACQNNHIVIDIDNLLSYLSYKSYDTYTWIYFNKKNQDSSIEKLVINFEWEDKKNGIIRMDIKNKYISAERDEIDSFYIDVNNQNLDKNPNELEFYVNKNKSDEIERMYFVPNE